MTRNSRRGRRQQTSCLSSLISHLLSLIPNEAVSEKPPYLRPSVLLGLLAAADSSAREGKGAKN